ncbi:glycosyltransferase family 4 protein [Rothia nasimurium]|uniref:glycosyltransferase family 4 protein n=1 Tax=Rothia nasimurium TaxID=85336 RepID=UPI001F4813A6|nr:glycosyltransferase family 4 protein [Rothia nasimurium]
MAKVAIATNNGDIGGGEVMLLNIAEALRANGEDVLVIGPSAPSELVDAARSKGLPVLVLSARKRLTYMMRLRIWHYRNSKTLLWCNGMLPSVATAGHSERIIHLHQLPVGKLKVLEPIARFKSRITLVPSNFMARKIANSIVLPNWVHPVSSEESKNIDENFQGIPAAGRTIRVGFLGRTSTIKGTHILCKAIKNLNSSASPADYHLVIGGTARFIDDQEYSVVAPELEAVKDVTTEMGWVTPAEFMKNIDILVVPSVWEEPFGLVAAEAMSSKKPLIVTRSGGLPEVVGENYPWICKSNDVNSLAQMIEKVATTLSHHPEEATEIVAAAYERWVINYSPVAGQANVERVIKHFG